MTLECGANLTSLRRREVVRRDPARADVFRLWLAIVSLQNFFWKGPILVHCIHNLLYFPFSLLFRLPGQFDPVYERGTMSHN